MAEKILLKGNQAMAEAAVQAGCRFFAGYPITPQNEIPEYMSKRMPEVGGVFVQAESELAAINMVFGAAATGSDAPDSPIELLILTRGDPDYVLKALEKGSRKMGRPIEPRVMDSVAYSELSKKDPELHERLEREKIRLVGAEGE